MKITYVKLSAISFFIAAVILLFLIKINTGYSKEIGRCVIQSNHIKKVQEGFGRKMRLCVGRIHPYDRDAHEWAEWWNEKRKKWCLWDRYKSWYTADESGYTTYLMNVKPLDS